MTLKDDVTTDLDEFLNSNEFAEDFTFSRSGLTITGIFDDAFEVAVEEGQGVESSQPQVIVKDSDVTGIIQGDTLTRASNSVVYKATGIHPDGTGLTLILLSQD